MSEILFTSTLVYAFGQIFNGLITDRIGGKKAMLIGAAGTVTMNILFGAASVWGILGVFIAIRAIDGYFQSFGAHRYDQRSKPHGSQKPNAAASPAFSAS